MGKQSHLVPQYGMTIPATWAMTTLGELCGINGGTVQTGPFGSQLHRHDYKPTGTPVVMPTQLGDNQIDTDEIARISDEDRDRLSRHILQVGDIVFSRRGDVTRRAYITRKEAGWLCGTGCMVIRARHPSVDSKYLSLFFSLPIFKKYIVGQAVGATMPNLNTGILETIPVFFPPLPEQQRIAAILSAYDDLIANNRRRIEILEEMARRIYREWFVEFRFPGHENVNFVDSPMGKIPEGWEPIRLADVSLNFDRKRKPLSSMERATRKGPYPYYGAAKIFDYIDDYIFDGDYLLVAEDGSVITPDRRPVLQFATARFWANNHTHILQGKSPISTEFLYFSLFDQDVTGYVTGAAQPKITQANLNRLPVLVPDKRILEWFNGIARDFIRQIKLSEARNDVLARTRDFLLPRLISGELDVSDLPIDCGVEDGDGA